MRDRVSLKDAQGTHYGVITVMRVDGLCSVKWDSGITELVPESELTFVEGGAPEYPPFENSEELPVEGASKPSVHDRIVAWLERLR